MVALGSGSLCGLHRGMGALGKDTAGKEELGTNWKERADTLVKIMGIKKDLIGVGLSGQQPGLFLVSIFRFHMWLVESTYEPMNL